MEEVEVVVEEGVHIYLIQFNYFGLFKVRLRVFVIIKEDYYSIIKITIIKITIIIKYSRYSTTTIIFISIYITSLFSWLLCYSSKASKRPRNGSFFELKLGYPNIIGNFTDLDTQPPDVTAENTETERSSLSSNRISSGLDCNYSTLSPSRPILRAYMYL